MPINSRRSSRHGSPAKLSFYRHIHVRLSQEMVLAMDSRLAEWREQDKSYNDIVTNALKAYLGVDQSTNDQSNESSFNPLA